jgi:phosphomevalonate kinase
VVLPNEFVTSLRAPDFGFAVVYTGVSANTRERVDQFRTWRQRPGSDEVLTELATEAADGIQAIVAGNAAAWCEQVRRFAQLERRMTEEGVDIFSAPVTRAVDTLESAGWAAKPSGAGGGDVVVAFHPSARPDELDEVCTSAGFERIPLALAPCGVLVSPA